MAIGYCMYHLRYLDKKEIKYKRCRCKANTKRKCKYFINTAKRKYRNDTNHIGKRRTKNKVVRT